MDLVIPPEPLDDQLLSMLSSGSNVLSKAPSCCNLIESPHRHVVVWSGVQVPNDTMVKASKACSFCLLALQD